MDTSKTPKQLQREICTNYLNTALYHLRQAIEHAHKADVSFKQTVEIASIGSRIEYVREAIKDAQ